MALNFSNGKPICIIDSDGQPIKYKNELAGNIVYVNNDDNDKKQYIQKFNKLDIKDAKFQLIPDTDKGKLERNTNMLVIGQNGVGKSYFIGKYVELWHKIYPKAPIILISEKIEDPALDFKYIKRTKLSDDLIKNPLSLEEFKDVSPCLIIADDIDSISVKLRKSIYESIDKILKVGRSYGINIIVSLHDYNGKETKNMLNECESITFFPQNWTRKTEYLVKEYMGLKNTDIDKIRNNKSRACTYLKTYPNVIVQEHNIFVIGKD
jgi:GTPase SAR1 family protein